jgi:hypothetical protein
MGLNSRSIELLRHATEAYRLRRSHWPERLDARKFIYAAVAFLAVAALIGYHFGVFAS